MVGAAPSCANRDLIAGVTILTSIANKVASFMKNRLTIVPDAGPNKSAICVAVIAGLIIAVGVIAIWYVIDQRAHEHARSATDHVVHMNQLLIRQDTDNRLAALDRLAHRWTASGDKPRIAWEADATRYVADMPGFESIQWVDSTMQARWGVPEDRSVGAADLDITGIEQAQIAMQLARNSGNVMVSQPFELDKDGLGVVVSLPVSRAQSFDGVIVGVFRLAPWLEAVIGNLQSADHHVQILLEGREVYRFEADNDIQDSSRTEQSTFETHGLNWTILVVPTSSLLSAGHADSSTLVLVVGLLLSALVAVTVYLAIEARQHSRQFRDVATQLATLFQNLPGMAYRRANQPDWPMEFVSEGCRALSGFSRNDFDERRKVWLDLVHPDDRERVAGEMRRAIDAGEAFELEYRIVRKSGDERWVWERGRSVTSGAGDSSHVEGFISDISEQRAAENEARQHREHLAHVDRLNMLGEMATGIAHEINQPLTAISLFVQAGSRLAGSDDEKRLPEIFDKLNQHAHRASAVIERMQNMARREGSAKEIISCGVLIDGVARLAEAEARIRDLTIDVDTASGLPDVSVDPVQIQQVVLNLLRNGMESMQHSNCNDSSSIGLRTRLDDDGNIEVAVIDHGSGVSDEAADSLFTPFSTTKKSGIGMGLSISRAIMIAHGGRLGYYNNREGGATFFFALPPVDQEERND